MMSSWKPKMEAKTSQKLKEAKGVAAATGSPKAETTMYRVPPYVLYRIGLTRLVSGGRAEVGKAKACALEVEGEIRQN